MSSSGHRRHAFSLQAGVPLTEAQMNAIEGKIRVERRWYYREELADMRARKGLLKSREDARPKRGAA